MEPLLIGVTLLSLMMAVAMGVVAWRLLRDERRRADARVAALTELAGLDPTTRAPAPLPGPAARRAEPPPPAERPRPLPVAPRGARASQAPVFDLPLRTDRPPADGSRAPVGQLFEAPAAPASSGSRAVALALVAAAMAIAIGLLWQLGGGRGAGAGAAAAPIELVSLAHDRQGDTLRITGLVQNPRAGEERRDVVAVAFLFDHAGTLVASGRAPIDFTRLAPGDESPFVVLVADAEQVARYRLGFRTRDGRVLAHVDRRSDPAAAGGASVPGPAEIAVRAAR